jgi:GNAT superfamily N-acetyltransferase
MNPVTIDIFPQDPNSDVARRLLEQYYAELRARIPDGFDLAVTIAAAPEELVPPFGTFLVVRVDGDPVGCGVVRVLTDSIAEIKRMWISPDARGRGLGRRLLIALESSAADLGCSRVRLDTNGVLDEAIGLYQSMGYREIAPYNENVYATRWFEKTKT